MNPFLPWLKKLVGNEISILTIVGDNRFYNDGLLVMVENDLCLLKKNDTIYFVNIDKIIEINGKKELFVSKKSRAIVESGFAKWLRKLKNKYVKITTVVGKEKLIYRGTPVAQEKNLCLFRKNDYENEIYLFMIDKIIEMCCDEISLAPRTIVTIEEVA